ncbi:hypothetical protein K2X40_04365 [Candidatus Babeliales bacterium]|nr:hypothetical protein [Candidatus Babeliales bacterium]
MKKLLMISLLFASSQLSAAAGELLNSVNELPDEIIAFGTKFIQEGLQCARKQAHQKGIKLSGSAYKLYTEISQSSLKQFIINHPEMAAKANALQNAFTQDGLEKIKQCRKNTAELNEENSDQQARLKAWAREYFWLEATLGYATKDEFPEKFFIAPWPTQNILNNNGIVLTDEQYLVFGSVILASFAGFAYRYAHMTEEDFKSFIGQGLRERFDNAIEEEPDEYSLVHIVPGQELPPGLELLFSISPNGQIVPIGQCPFSFTQVSEEELLRELKKLQGL